MKGINKICIDWQKEIWQIKGWLGTKINVVKKNMWTVYWKLRGFFKEEKRENKFNEYNC